LFVKRRKRKLPLLTDPLVEKFGVILGEYCPQGRGRALGHQVNFRGMTSNIDRLIQQIADSSRARIPIDMRRSPRHENRSAYTGLDLILANLNAQDALKHLPRFIVTVMEVAGRN